MIVVVVVVVVQLAVVFVVVVVVVVVVECTLTPELKINHKSCDLLRVGSNDLEKKKNSPAHDLWLISSSLDT